jgi:hypothetical protein
LPLGWALTEGGGSSNDNEQYAAGNGSSATGDTYSYGATGSTERAFGELRSGGLIPIFGASFTNSTGVSISSIDVAYTGEQWRLGAVLAGRIDRIDFQISTDATSLATGTWIDVNALDFTDPVVGPAAGALDGNVSPNRTAVAATIAGQDIAAGSTFWIRWTDVDAASNDDGLAVDDFSLTPHTTNASTNPSGTGAASPSSVAAGASTLLP